MHTDWFHGLSDHLMFLSAQRLDLFEWCVRLSRLWVGFWTHFKSLHFSFHFISFTEFYQNALFTLSLCDVRTTRTECATGPATSAVPDAVESCVLTRLHCEMHLDEPQGTAWFWSSRLPRRHRMPYSSPRGRHQLQPPRGTASAAECRHCCAPSASVGNWQHFSLCTVCATVLLTLHRHRMSSTVELYVIHLLPLFLLLMWRRASTIR